MCAFDESASSFAGISTVWSFDRIMTGDGALMTRARYIFLVIAVFLSVRMFSRQCV